MSDELSRGRRLVKSLTAMDEEQRQEHQRKHESNVNEAISNIKLLETAHPPQSQIATKEYLINYRIRESQIKLKSTYNERYDSLIRLIKALHSAEQHKSTSSWKVTTKIQDARTIIDNLKVAVEESLDYLSVMEINSNRSSIGDANLE